MAASDLAKATNTAFLASRATSNSSLSDQSYIAHKILNTWKSKARNLVRSATAKSDPFWGSRAGGGGECSCSPGQLRYPSRAPGTLRDRPPQLITRPRMTASRYLASQLDSHLAAQIALRAKRSTYINKQTHKEITHQPTNQPTNQAHKYTQNQKHTNPQTKEKKIALRLAPQQLS